MKDFSLGNIDDDALIKIFDLRLVSGFLTLQWFPSSYVRIGSL